MRILVRTIALMGMVLGLAACGGSSSHKANAGQSAPTSTSTPAPTTDTATHTTTTPSAPPTPASTRCTAATLALSFIGQQGATGHGVIGFALRNVSSHSCHTFGYPGVLFLTQSGAALPTKATRTTSDFGGPAPLHSLVVAPGGGVSFRLVVTHGINSQAGCTTAYGLQAIPPDDTATLRTTIPGGAYECGTTTVTPLQPGTSAYR